MHNWPQKPPERGARLRSTHVFPRGGSKKGASESGYRMIPEEVGIELATSHEGDLEGRWEDIRVRL